MGDLPDDNPVPKTPEPPPVPKVVEKIIYQDRPVIQTVYRDVPVQPTAEPEQVAAINEQIKALLKPTPGGFLVRSFAKGERPKPPEPRPAAAAAPGSDRPFGPGVRHATVARAGDVAYAVLDRGFNSDDPAAPIFATIVDLDERQQPGPLNGIRLLGQIVYSQTQGAIRFSTMILQDGRQGPMQAIAITVDQPGPASPRTSIIMCWSATAASSSPADPGRRPGRPAAHPAQHPDRGRQRLCGPVRP